MHRAQLELLGGLPRLRVVLARTRSLRYRDFQSNTKRWRYLQLLCSIVRASAENSHLVMLAVGAALPGDVRNYPRR
jgi:hypothetical protein